MAGKHFMKGTILEGGYGSFFPWSAEQNKEYFDDIDAGSVRNAMAPLDFLQLRRTYNISVATLDAAVQGLYRTLPLTVRDSVVKSLGFFRSAGPMMIPSFEGAYPGQHGWFSGTDEDFEAAYQKVKFPIDYFNKEYVVWIVNAGGETIEYNSPSDVKPERQHYLTIVMRFEPSDPVNKPSVRDRVSHLAIVDPLYQEHESKDQEQRFRDLINSRLRKILPEVTFAEDCERSLWIPPLEPEVSKQDFATPFVAYSVTEQLFDRIGAMVLNGSGFSPEVLFAPLRPWFDLDKVRTDMWGLLIAQVMEKYNWKLRIAMTPIQMFMDHQAQTQGQPTDLKLWSDSPVGYNWKNFVNPPATTQPGDEPAGGSGSNGQDDIKQVKDSDSDVKGENEGETTVEDIDDLFGENEATAPPDTMDLDETDNGVPAQTNESETQTNVDQQGETPGTQPEQPSQATSVEIQEDEGQQNQNTGTQTDPSEDNKDSSTQTDQPTGSMDTSTQTETQEAQNTSTQTETQEAQNTSTQTETQEAQDIGTQTDPPEESQAEDAKPEVEDAGTQTDQAAAVDEGDDNNDNNDNNNPNEGPSGSGSGPGPGKQSPPPSTEHERRLDLYEERKRSDIERALDSAERAEDITLEISRRAASSDPLLLPTACPSPADLASAIRALSEGTQAGEYALARADADAGRIRDVYDFELHAAVEGGVGLEAAFAEVQGVLDEGRGRLAAARLALWGMQVRYGEDGVVGRVRAGMKRKAGWGGGGSGSEESSSSSSSGGGGGGGDGGGGDGTGSRSSSSFEMGTETESEDEADFDPNEILVFKLPRYHS